MTVDQLIAALTKLRDDDPAVGAMHVETVYADEYDYNVDIYGPAVVRSRQYAWGVYRWVEI